MTFVADVQQRVENWQLDSSTARQNLLVNGGFEIWQRGNGPFTANQARLADYWFITLGGTSTMSVSRDTTNQDVGSGACAVVTYTHNAASYVGQKIEDFANLRGRTVTLSVRVRTSTANAVRLQLDTVGAGALSLNSSYHTGGGTYETLTITASIPAGATGLFVYPRFDASCTAYVDNAMLVVGNVPADFTPLHPADDLARCQRYYQRWQPGVSGASVATGQCYGTTGGLYLLPFSTRLSVTPTFTSSPPATDWNATNSTAAQVACSSISGQALNTASAMVNLSGASGLAAGNASHLVTANVNAWLALEANP